LLNVAGWALAKLAISSQTARVMQNFGHFSVFLVTAMSAILMGIILLHKELDRKTIFTLIPKPVRRYEIVLGKFVGLSTLLTGQVFLLGLAWYLFLGWHDALHVAEQPISTEILKALVLLSLEATLITSVALVFSSWTRPFLSGVFTFGYFLMGHSIFLLNEHLGARSGVLSEEGPLRSVATVVTYVVPDLNQFNISDHFAAGRIVGWEHVLDCAGYAFSFSAIFLAIAVILFTRRDFV